MTTQRADWPEPFRLEHSDYGLTDAGLNVLRARVLARTSTSTRRRCLLALWEAADDPLVYDRLVLDRRFDPLADADRDATDASRQ